MSRAAAALLRERSPEPARCWIRYAPARWPGPASPWLDLADGTLGESAGEPEVLAALEGLRLEDLLYLPPVPADLAAARDRLAARHAGRGTPVLVQLLPGDPAPATDGVVVVRDLLGVALAADADLARSLHPEPLGGAVAATWPLAAGLWDEPRVEHVTSAAAAAGLRALQGVALELAGRDRRELGSALGEERYLRLFHEPAPSGLPLAKAAARHGLRPILRRPLPRPPLRGAGNLRVAAALAEAAELCHLLGEPESLTQDLLRAARFAERASQDLVALHREGNLAVLPWLEGEVLEVAAAGAAGLEPALWRELMARLDS